jgi:hypothetical protein
MGWMEVGLDLDNPPQDIVAQDTKITNSASLSGRVLHNVTSATSVTFNGVGLSDQTADILATATLYGAYNDGKFVNEPFNNLAVGISLGATYFQVSSASGDIRGQIYPLLKRTLKRYPYKADTVNGNTIVPAKGFATLRRENLIGNENNQNSYVNLVSSLSTSNYTYLGVFYFNGAVNRRNVDLVRGYNIDLNARIGGAGTWLFEIFDATSGQFLPVGTLTSASSNTTWIDTSIVKFVYGVKDYLNKRSQLAIRISVNSASSTSMALDVFSVRTWIPGSIRDYEPGANEAFKDTIKLLNTYPGKFKNGTLYNP